MVNYTTKIVKSKSVKEKIGKYFEEVEIYQRKRKFKSNKLLSNILMNFIVTGISFFSLSVACKKKIT